MPEENTSSENPFSSAISGPAPQPIAFRRGQPLTILSRDCAAVDGAARSSARTARENRPYWLNSSPLWNKPVNAWFCSNCTTASADAADWRRQTESSKSSTVPIVVVDGYEQLGGWTRFWLKSYCRRKHLGLLVTSHNSVGLPEIFHTLVTPEIAAQIVGQLLQRGKMAISKEIVADLLSRHQGDMREVLFDLYDRFEEQRKNCRRDQAE